MARLLTDCAELELALGPSLVGELTVTAEALALLAVALPPLRPPPVLYERLLASARGSARFAPFIDRLARLIDITTERARELLTDLAVSTLWEPSPEPNIRLLHLKGGPSLAGAEVGFVHIAAGTIFPPHRHLGEERALILQGTYEDNHYTVAVPGDVLRMPANSSHHVIAGPETDLIYAVVVFGGVEIEAGVDPC